MLETRLDRTHISSSFRRYFTERPILWNGGASSRCCDLHTRRVDSAMSRYFAASIEVSHREFGSRCFAAIVLPLCVTVV